MIHKFVGMLLIANYYKFLNKYTWLFNIEETFIFHFLF